MPARALPSRRRRAVASITTRVALYLSICWATLCVLAAGTFPGAVALLLAIALYTTLPLGVFARWRGWPFYPSAAFRLLVVRPFWYTQLLLPLTVMAGLAGAVAGLPFGAPLTGARIAAMVVLVGASVALVAGYAGARRLVVRHVDAAIPELPREFDGLRIVQLSDLHIGPHSSRRFLQRVVDATRALAPDLIAITGDLVDDRAEDVRASAAALGGLEVPLGVFVIPGNHDVYAGSERVEEALRATGIGTVLVNETRIIRRGDALLALVGTGDPAAGRRGNSARHPRPRARSGPGA